MKLTRKVNGIEVELSVEEQQAHEKESDANRLKSAAKERRTGYIRKRARAYAKAFSITDQIDIIQKQLQSMADKGEVELTNESFDWLSTIEHIKTNYPKPE